MPVSQLPQAPYRQDRKIFPTPIIGDVLFSEVRDCNRGNPFPEYGTPYPNSNKWPDHKLVYIKPVDIERNEIFEFFYTLRINNWEGVWQLDQFPFREDTVEAARLSIETLKAIYRALDDLDMPALRDAQARQDALAAQRIVQRALLSSMAGQ